MTGWQWTWLTASFFCSENKPKQGQASIFFLKSTTPLLTYVVAGPLADHVFEPMMAINGPLAGSIGQILGVGPGRGIGLLFVSMGLLLVLITAISYLSPHLRCVEDELPDAVPGQPIHAEAAKVSLMPLPASD